MMSSLFTKTVIYLQPRVKNTYVTSLNRQKSGLLIDVLNMYFKIGLFLVFMTPSLYSYALSYLPPYVPYDP